MRKRQVNIRLDEEEYETLKTAAEELELTVSGFVRWAALDAAAPEPEPDDSNPGLLPAWLLAVLLYLRQGRISPDSSKAEGGVGAGRRRARSQRQ